MQGWVWESLQWWVFEGENVSVRMLVWVCECEYVSVSIWGWVCEGDYVRVTMSGWLCQVEYVRVSARVSVRVSVMVSMRGWVYEWCWRRNEAWNGYDRNHFAWVTLNFSGIPACTPSTAPTLPLVTNSSVVRTVRIATGATVVARLSSALNVGKSSRINPYVKLTKRFARKYLVSLAQKMFWLKSPSRQE